MELRQFYKDPDVGAVPLHRRVTSSRMRSSDGLMQTQCKNTTRQTKTKVNRQNKRKT